VHGLVVKGVPHHERHLHDDERDADREQVPVRDVIHVEPVLEQQDRSDAPDDAGRARGPLAVGQESFIENTGEDVHGRVSSVKISSVAHANTRANKSASGRLGT